MKNKDIYKKSVRYLIDNRFAIQKRPLEFAINSQNAIDLKKDKSTLQAQTISFLSVYSDL